MFFGSETVTDAVSLDLGMPQTEPVQEEIITPKKAYLCQPEQQEQVQQVIDWGVDEDPWATAASVEPAAEVVGLQARITELEQQKAELQTKIAKLMKRVKEYRAKEQQQQEQSKSVHQDNDLDGAIMDELRHQLQLHESRQLKTEELLQQHALEKEKLSKRIDVLTAGNERMAELKERQDMDVQMYQARIRELQEKIQQLESWGDGGAPVGDATMTQPTASLPATTSASTSTDNETLAKIENLQAENQDLNTECLELQSQLQQEKQNALDALAQLKKEREQLQADKPSMRSWRMWSAKGQL